MHSHRTIKLGSLLAMLLLVAPWIVSGTLTEGEMSAMRSLLHSYPSLAYVNPWRTYTLKSGEEVNFGTPWNGDFSQVCGSGAKYSYFGISCTPNGHIGGITIHPDWGLRNGTACLELEGLLWLTNVTMANTPGIGFHRGTRTSELLSALLNLYDIKHLEVWSVPRERMPFEEILSESSLETLVIEVNGPNITSGLADSIFGTLANLRELTIATNLVATTLTDSLVTMPYLESLTIQSMTLTSLGSNFSDMVPNLKQLTIEAQNLVSLEGPFPSSLESLTLLNHLSLISVTGSWPDSLKQLTIDYATSFSSALPTLPLGLESFSLRRSYPTSLAAALNENLKKLSLIGYELTGDMDLPMDKLRNLEELTIEAASIDTSLHVPLWLCRLPSTLRSLEMPLNTFGPTLPSCLFNTSATASFPHLVNLVVNEASLTDSAIANILPASLRHLQLSGNRFPNFPDLSPLSNLNHLDLSHNAHPWEQVPAWIGNLPLQTLNLNQDLFSSPLPSNLFSRGTLEVLRLDSNRFPGSIPLDNPGAASLRYLYISRNNFSDIPTMQYATNLRELTIQSNLQRLTVPSSEDFALALNLTHVDISSTEMTQMPMFWKNHPNVEYFDASNCESPGYMPASIYSPRLRFLHLGRNPIVGTVPEFETPMTMLLFILFSNNIDGTIPASIQNVHFLGEFQISHNNISGNLYQVQWSQHTAMYLENLALNNNSLSGPMPDWSQWISLQRLELSKTRVHLCVPEQGNILNLPPVMSTCDFRFASLCECEAVYNQTCAIDTCVTMKRGEKGFDPFSSNSPLQNIYRSSYEETNGQKSQPLVIGATEHAGPKKKELLSLQCVPAPIYIPPPQTPSPPSSSTTPVPETVDCIHPQPPGQFHCIGGVWHSNASITSPTFSMPPSIQVFINGNLTVTLPITFSGLDSVVYVNGCVFLQSPEVIVKLSEKQEEELKKLGKTTKTLITSVNGNECSGATDLSTVIVNTSIKKSCRKITSNNVGSKSTLSVVFQMEEKRCKVNLIVPIVVGSVLGLVILGTLVVVLVWKPWYKKPGMFAAGTAARVAH